MSDLSVLLHKAEAFFAAIATPASKTAASNAATAVGGAIGAIEAAIPNLAKDAANAALALIPGGLGSEFDGIADSLIDEVVVLLVAKKSTAAPAPTVAVGR